MEAEAPAASAPAGDEKEIDVKSAGEITEEPGIYMIAASLFKRSRLQN